MRPPQARNPIHHATASARPPSFNDVMPATVAERRVMKKVAQPEHAYTGCVPQCEEQEAEALPVRRNPPILGYKGHLRNAEDRIGTTFTNGLETALRASELAGEHHQRGRTRDLGQKERDIKIQQAPAHRVHFQPQAPPQHGQHHERGYQLNLMHHKMAPGSGYGKFDNASGYGEFQAPPPMSARSGYGAFDGASGYGEFQEPPSANQQVSPDSFVQQQHLGLQENASSQPSSYRLELKLSESLDQKYQRALKSVGGKANALKLWHAAAASISSRYRKRTELLQAIKRSFEKSERENCGNMTKKHLKEALQTLACVFTDDQITALFGLYDVHCTGEVPMETLLFALTDCL